jgi:hypothetical protein
MKQLPQGYNLKTDEHALLIFVQKDGVTIRKANKQPVSFPIDDRCQAIRYAWQHHNGGTKCKQTN